MIRKCQTIVKSRFRDRSIQAIPGHKHWPDRLRLCLSRVIRAFISSEDPITRKNQGYTESTI
jgi:hypothetical protein